MHVDGLSFPMHVCLKYYYNEQTSKQMNVVNTRTNICYIHGCHTRTNHQKHQLLLMYFTSWNDFIQKPKVLKNNHARLHENMPQDQLGGIFILFIVKKIYNHAKPKLRRKVFMQGCMRTCNKFSWGVC
jgi:hypothetical protein